MVVRKIERSEQIAVFGSEMKRCATGHQQLQARRSVEHGDEQLHAGFHDVACGYCGVTVLVRKMSPKQTSVQWTGDSSVCPYLNARDRKSTRLNSSH